MKIGIVAHDARKEMAWNMFLDTKADFISLDNGSLGPRANHLVVWDHLVEMSEDGEWCVVLEDDALLCENFMTQLGDVIAWAPRDVSVISLYMGRQNPRQWQKHMYQAVAQANSSHACWITSRFAIHGVGLAMRREDAEKFLYDVHTTVGAVRPIDETLSAWCRRTKKLVGYCHPSIVNHRDGDTLITHPDNVGRQKGRVAWEFGGRDRWSRMSIPLDPNER